MLFRSNATHYRISVNGGPMVTTTCGLPTNAPSALFLGTSYNLDAWARGQVDDAFIVRGVMSSNQIYQAYTNGLNGQRSYPYPGL